MTLQGHHLAVPLAVPGRNRSFFHSDFQSCYRIQSLLLRVELMHIVDAWIPDKSTVLHMSPALGEIFVLQCFKHDIAVEIHDRKLFDFHPGLPYMYNNVAFSVQQKILYPCTGV